MAAGLQVFAADGSNVAQIDSEGGMPNFQLRQKLTQITSPVSIPVWTISDGSRYSSSGYGTTFTFTAINPLAVFECSGSYCVPHQWTRNGNTYTVFVLCKDSNVAISLYVFDQASAAVVPNNFGLQVFDAGGVLIADITTPFARPRGVATGNPKYAVGSTGYATDSGTWQQAQGSYGFPVAQRVGIACVEPSFAAGGGSGGATNAGMNLSMFNTAGGTVNVAMIGCGDNSNNNNYTGFREALTWRFMAVDISYL